MYHRQSVGQVQPFGSILSRELRRSVPRHFALHRQANRAAKGRYALEVRDVKHMIPRASIIDAGRVLRICWEDGRRAPQNRSLGDGGVERYRPATVAFGIAFSTQVPCSIFNIKSHVSTMAIRQAYHAEVWHSRLKFMPFRLSRFIQSGYS